MKTPFGARSRFAMASAAALALLALQAAAVAPAPVLLSADDAGVPGNGHSYEGAVTPNGRWVVFDTVASNLGLPSSASDYQIVLLDRKTGERTLVSHGAAGAAGNGDSNDPCISANGRWITYYSDSDNLVAGDANGFEDLFLYDRLTDETTIVSRKFDGGASDGDTEIYGNCLSPNGRFLTFYSRSSNLVEGVTSLTNQVYLADLRKGTVSLVSTNPAGNAGNDDSRYPSLSPNGRFIAFQSDATDLLPMDLNGNVDIFVKDLHRGTLVRASVSTAGVEGNGASQEPVVSNSGRYVAFRSGASNLVAADGNGFFDVFLRDTRAGTTVRISQPLAGGDGLGGHANECCMTASGKTVVFYTYATNLNPDQPSPDGGTYLYDAGKKTLRQIDLAENGDAPDGNSYVMASSLTPTGKYLLVSSEATQFTTGDTQGVYQMYLFQLR